MKRFYKHAEAGPHEKIFRILLDGKSLKTPGNATVEIPTRELAQAVAKEWDEQGETIDPQTMPLTKLTYAAIDSAQLHRETIVDQLVRFGGNDLLCYRAESPDKLIAREAAAWDPILDWAEKRFGARLRCGSGIVHVSQPAEPIAAFEKAVRKEEAFGLVALHSAATLTGSLVLALALNEGWLSSSDTFAAANVGEAFQAESWGEDFEAKQRSDRHADELAATERFMRLLTA